MASQPQKYVPPQLRKPASTVPSQAMSKAAMPQPKSKAKAKSHPSQAAPKAASNHLLPDRDLQKLGIRKLISIQYTNCHNKDLADLGVSREDTQGIAPEVMRLIDTKYAQYIADLSDLIARTYKKDDLKMLILCRPQIVKINALVLQCLLHTETVCATHHDVISQYNRNRESWDIDISEKGNTLQTLVANIGVITNDYWPLLQDLKEKLPQLQQVSVLGLSEQDAKHQRLIQILRQCANGIHQYCEKLINQCIKHAQMLEAHLLRKLDEFKIPRPIGCCSQQSIEDIQKLPCVSIDEISQWQAAYEARISPSLHIDLDQYQ